MRKRVLQQILSGASDDNVRFEDLRSLLAGMDFEERVRGDPHVFSKPEVAEILNLQPRGSAAKPYQVKQVRARHRPIQTSERHGMTKYEIILYWSAEDNAFIAEDPELPGSAADGETRIQALENLETVIQEWIETAHALGRPIPARKGRLLFA